VTEPIRVLLVDDHELVRRGTRDVLELSPDLLVVGEAQDGQEAVELVRRERPDVVLMDVNMPGMNGIEATRLIKREARTTAVLGLSAFDDEPFVVQLLEAGAAGYLLKNVRGPELIAAVQAVRRGESILDPTLDAKLKARAAAQRDHGGDEHGTLTAREVEVLRHAAKGLTNKEIARVLKISNRTVQVHLANTFAKLGVGSRTEAVLHALRAGTIDLADASA
jgi:DNA-binding NarL/FixJ family response regulator